jgi:hypothetical protein
VTGPPAGAGPPSLTAPPTEAGPPTLTAPPTEAGPPTLTPPRTGFHRPWLVLTVVVALLVLAVSAALLLRRGGAASPTEAAHGLAAAVSDHHYLDALGLLAPNEADVLTDAHQVLVKELTRLQVLKPNADLDAGAAAVTLSNLRFDDAQAEQVRDNVTIIKLVGGTITINEDTGDLPLTDSFRQLALSDGIHPDGARTELDIAQLTGNKPIRIATVRVDGRWYVSLLYTWADLLTTSVRKPWPTGSVPARGAATPDGAVRDSVQAMLSEDARRLVELAPPEELQVVHDLGELLIQEAGTPHSTTRLVDLQTAPADMPGETAVVINRIAWEDRSYYYGGRRQYSVAREGDCLLFTGTDSGSNRFCAAGLANAPGTRMFSRLATIRPEALAAATQTRVVVVKVDGQYYVSPTKTMIHYLEGILATLQPGDVSALVH